jgi:D-arginine dehydrogenase
MIYDVAIIGAGIAGASLAACLDPRMHVIVIEQEERAGLHSTGRSASFWDECYGGPDVQPLTTASGSFLRAPPVSFSERGFLLPRGVLYLGRREDTAAIEAMEGEFAGSGVKLERLSSADIRDRVPVLKADWSVGLYGGECSDIDVAGLHASYLGQARRNDVRFALRSKVDAAEWAGGRWRVSTSTEQIEARTLVNAAGAWADDIAQLGGVQPIGITAYRRTISQVRTDPPAPKEMPLVIDINGDFYFKPEAGGRLWLSPHDETLSPPCDAAPEELDIALAINRFEEASVCRVAAVEHSWAGLRSFAPDRLPVYGFDPDNPAFFWCAGQGGFGIQTAPAAAQLCAALMGGEGLSIAIDASRYSPSRFR